MINRRGKQIVCVQQIIKNLYYRKREMLELLENTHCCPTTQKILHKSAIQ